MNIDWGVLLYELRHKFAPRDIDEFEGAILNLHPERMNDLKSFWRKDGPWLVECDWHNPFKPATAMGIAVYASRTVPRDMAFLCIDNRVVASIHFVLGTIYVDRAALRVEA